MNDPRTIIAHDWANPAIRQHIHVYPEIPSNGIISEIWHAEKWRKDMDLDALSPMYDAGPRGHFFVNERLRRRPLWYRRCRTRNVQSPKTAPYIPSFVDYFGDDVSGNRSKSWNKHWNAYMTHRNLPRKLLMQEFHVHFISTSPHASISEQYREFKAAVVSTHTEPVVVQDEHGQTTCFSIYCNAGPSDNPMQSEISSHIGARGNCFCRKHVSIYRIESHNLILSQQPGIPRTKEYLLEELQTQVRLVCSGRSIDQLRSGKQRETGVKDMYTQHWLVGLEKRHADLRLADPDRELGDVKAELLKWTEDNDEKIYSAFLTTPGEISTLYRALGANLDCTAFDPTVDTPIEVLHTILLGAVKYVWHISHTSWSAANKKTYSHRLQATDRDGLSIQAIRANYIMQYANSLIGKQLKTIVQTAIFHVHDIVSDEYLVAWRALGELSALLWVPEIRNLKDYQKDLKIAVANLLDAISVIDPSKVITKMKYHLLVHAPDDATDFGPLLGMATELFESYNAIFRYCSIYSNHLAPSRDIAAQLGEQENLKHRLTGGRWAQCGDGEVGASRPRGALLPREAPGPAATARMDSPCLFQGWRYQIGRNPSRADDAPTTRLLRDTAAAKVVAYGGYPPDSAWDICKSVLAQSLDECIVDSWIFAELPSVSASPNPGPAAATVVPGRIVEILRNAEHTIVVIERFECSATRDEHYGMPVLTPPDENPSLTLIKAADLKFNFNVQHDCRAAKCTASGTRTVMQERVESQKTENFIEHRPVKRYILNMHSFHNPHLIRATLPDTSGLRFRCSPIAKPSTTSSLSGCGTRKRRRRVCSSVLPRTRSSMRLPGASMSTVTVGMRLRCLQRELGARDREGEVGGRGGRGRGRGGRGGGRVGGKRRREADDADGDEAPPAKRPRQTKEKQTQVIALTVAAAISGETSLAAGRAPCTIRQTERARLSAQQANESDSDEELETDDMGVEGDDEDAAYGADGVDGSDNDEYEGAEGDLDE
ncbi:hypothetical protein HMN09_00678300 [Mycena chlorophos]|uniref:Uncharacterized protein n=1 Tax=Mycena chlorophos TaxID=658473 RepID=A0A8H6SZS3_MYCCL|nr:hypothetical protein HMN09_00678300 [Mycena chlorophos]